MTEILFYHLEQASLQQVLPTLLEKTMERGWKAVVEVGQPERIDELDATLWTYRPDSFLPHATEAEPLSTDHPVILTAGDTNPNMADVRFYVHRAVPRAENAAMNSYTRLVFMFDGHDPDAVTDARNAWRALSSDHETTYWQQSGNGRWEKKA